MRLAAVCLLIGLAVGYLFRGSRSVAIPASAAQASVAPGAAPAGMGAAGAAGNSPVSLDQMKHMADKQAEPLLAKLKDDPENAELLAHVGQIYLSTHQFKAAADYFGKSLAVNPKNNPIRTQLAACLYYSGDADGAIKQLEKATTDDPKDANALFNLGMIRWKGKKDSKGALVAWEQLLKNNPELDPNKRVQVQKLMGEVQSGSGEVNQ